MIILIGLVLLLAAVVVGVLGVMTNGGSTHAMGGNFAVFGYHVTGSTGTLFLDGVVVGAVGLCGLSLLVAGARRTARRGRVARRELKDSRRDTVSVGRNRDDLVEPHQRETADATAAPDRASGSTAVSESPTAGRGLLRSFGRRQPVNATRGDAHR
jgi:hypothetical protein